MTSLLRPLEFVFVFDPCFFGGVPAYVREFRFVHGCERAVSRVGS